MPEKLFWDHGRASYMLELLIKNSLYRQSSCPEKQLLFDYVYTRNLSDITLLGHQVVNLDMDQEEDDENEQKRK